MSVRCACGRFASRLTELTVELFNARGERISITRSYRCKGCMEPGDDEIEAAAKHITAVV